MRNGARKWLPLGMAALVAGIPLAALAADVFQTRVAGYRELGAAFKNVNDELKSSTPQPMVLQMSARTISSVAKAQYGWFPAGSGPEANPKSRAMPAIWTDAAQFKAAQDNFAKQAAAFNQAVAGGNIDAVRAQARALGGACGACHRNFRVER